MNPQVEGKEIAEGALIAYLDYVVRYEYNIMLRNKVEDMSSDRLVANIFQHIDADLRREVPKAEAEIGGRIRHILKQQERRG